MQQVSNSQQWPSLPWNQPCSMRSSLHGLHASGNNNNLAGPMRPQKLVLQPQPTGLGMQISYANPAGHQGLNSKPQHSAAPLDVRPWSAAGQPPMDRHHSSGSSSSFSTQTEEQPILQGEDSKGTVHEFYAHDRAAAAARPRKLDSVFRRQHNLRHPRQTSQRDPDEQQPQGEGQQTDLQQQQQDVASAKARPASADQQDDQDGLDLLMLVIQATEQEEAATAAEAAAAQQQHSATKQQQHVPVGKQEALLAACASALGQAEQSHSHAEPKAASPSSSLPCSTLPAPAVEEQASMDDAVPRDESYTRHAIAAALAAVESKAARAADSTAPRTTPVSAAAAEAVSTRPRRAAARGADLVRQVAMQEEQRQNKLGRKSVKHCTVDDRLRSLEVAAKLHHHRRKQQHTASLPPLPPLPRKRRHASPAFPPQHGSRSQAEPPPDPAAMPGPLAPASALAVAAAAAEAEAAARRSCSGVQEARPEKRFKFADATMDPPTPAAAPAAKELAALPQAAAAGASADAARAALAAAYAVPAPPAASRAHKQMPIDQSTVPAAATAATGVGSEQQQQQQQPGLQAAALLSPKARGAAASPEAPAAAKAAQAMQQGRAPAGRPPKRASGRTAQLASVAAGVKAGGGAGPKDSSAAAAGKAVSGGAKSRGPAARSSGRAAALQKSNPKPAASKAKPAAASAKAKPAVAGSAKVRTKPAAAAAVKPKGGRGRTTPAAPADGDSSGDEDDDTSNDDDTISRGSEDDDDDEDSQLDGDYRPGGMLATVAGTSKRGRGASAAGAGNAVKKPRQEQPAAAAAAGAASGAVAAAAAGPDRKSGPKGGRPAGVGNKNQMAPKGSKFGCRSARFTGVYKCQRLTVRWRTQFSFARKVLNVGSYPTEEDAARAWNAAAMHFRGGDCWVNPVEPVLPEDGGLAIIQSLPQPEGGSLLPAALKQAAKAQ